MTELDKTMVAELKSTETNWPTLILVLVAGAVLGVLGMNYYAPKSANPITPRNVITLSQEQYMELVKQSIVVECDCNCYGNLGSTGSVGKQRTVRTPLKVIESGN